MKNYVINLISLTVLILSLSNSHGQGAPQAIGKSTAIKEVFIEFLNKGTSVELRMRYGLPEVLGVKVDNNATQNAVWAIDNGVNPLFTLPDWLPSVFSTLNEKANS